MALPYWNSNLLSFYVLYSFLTLRCGKQTKSKNFLQNRKLWTILITFHTPSEYIAPKTYENMNDTVLVFCKEHLKFLIKCMHFQHILIKYFPFCTFFHKMTNFVLFIFSWVFGQYMHLGYEMILKLSKVLILQNILDFVCLPQRKVKKE